MSYADHTFGDPNPAKRWLQLPGAWLMPEINFVVAAKPAP